LKTGANTQHKQIYIVVSQTGTILSRILKRITGAEYNHASLSFSPDLLTMYSFGRMHPYNPVWGGFVKESPNSGTFKRFSGTRVVVLSITVSQEKYLKGTSKNVKFPLAYHTPPKNQGDFAKKCMNLS